MKKIITAFLFLIFSQTFAGDKGLDDFFEKTGFEKLKGKAPNFHLITTTNDTISLESFEGKFLLVHFWATWCKPCRKEMPEFAELEEELKNVDIEVLGVSIDSKSDSLQAVEFAERFSFPNALAISGEISEDYWAWGIPTTILISEEGMLLGRVRGVINWNNFSSLFKEYLSK